MIINLAAKRASVHFRAIILFLIAAFLLSTAIPYSQRVDQDKTYASVLPYMPAPGKLLNVSPQSEAPLLRGIKIFPDNPLKFEFIVYEGDKKIYFVAETKGTNDPNDPSLSIEERQKIHCGKKHFANFPEVFFKAPVKTLSDVLLR